MITLIVGTGAEAQTVPVHKSILERSPHFRTYLKDEWRQGQTPGTINLPEDDPLTIRFYLNYLYTNIIPLAYFVDLAELYVLGEYYCDIDFQNAVLFRLIDEIGRFSQFPGEDVVNRIYEATEGRPDAKGRSLMVEIYYRYGNKDWMKSGTCHGEFKDDLIQRVMGQEREGVWFGALRPEDYFEEPKPVGQQGGTIGPGVEGQPELKKRKLDHGEQEADGEQAEMEDPGVERKDEAGEKGEENVL